MNNEPDSPALRASIRADLARKRSRLLRELIGLDRTTLERVPIIEGLTVKTILLRVAEGDRRAAERTEARIAGRDGEQPLVKDARDVALDDAVRELLAARAAMLSAFAATPSAQLIRPEADAIVDMVVDRGAQDALWHGHIVAWRDSISSCAGIGPKCILIAGVRAARKELLTAVALMPEGERPRLVRLLARLSANEAETLAHLRQVIPQAKADSTRADAGDEEWASVWRRLHATHQNLLKLLDGTPEAALAASIGGVTAYRRLVDSLDRDREAAVEVRESQAQ